MNVKISEMPSATSLDGTELVPIVQSGVSKNVTKQILTNNNYSTSEQVVGTWIDGKPLYQKTIVYTTALTSGVNTIPHNVTNIERAFLISGIAPYDTQDFGFGNYQIPCFNTSTQYLTCTNVNANNVNVTVGSSWGSSFQNGCVVTIRYTKTTD